MRLKQTNLWLCILWQAAVSHSKKKNSECVVCLTLCDSLCELLYRYFVLFFLRPGGTKGSVIKTWIQPTICAIKHNIQTYYSKMFRFDNEIRTRCKNHEFQMATTMWFKFSLAKDRIFFLLKYKNNIIATL